VSTSLNHLRLALTALAKSGGPTRTLHLLRSAGLAGLEQLWAESSHDEQQHINEMVAKLADRQVGVLIFGDKQYPSRLVDLKSPPPLLFYRGNPDLLHIAGVGMCGSRNASPKGLDAARVCGEEVVRQGKVVISGYARGVDTETHLAALGAGGRTVIVLAEGILHYRPKRVFGAVGLDPTRILVLSQFPPGQRWTVGAAMTRNGVIIGLGQALVVIEAGEKGGTLNAGLQAVQMGRPVLALDFTTGAPTGNRILFDKGATRIRTRAELGAVIKTMGARGGEANNQLPLPLT
jgi:DNA processing protein